MNLQVGRSTQPGLVEFGAEEPAIAAWAGAKIRPMAYSEQESRRGEEKE